MSLQLGDLNIPIVETALFFVLILSLIFNTFLFRRGQGNYSIKYQLMRNQQFFRQHITFTYIIQAMYKFFFLLPFLLLIALSILASIRNINNLAPILINGLIIILILYPTKTEYYYYKLFAIWLLATGSQLSTFFIHEIKGDQAYYILSTIFYTGNILFFYLALVSIQKTYWEISEAIQKIPNEVTSVNSRWAQGKIPKVFDGGLYGHFCKNKYHYFQFTILYLISLMFLGAYAALVNQVLNSNLGIVGLVSAIIYDIFVQIFNSLDHEGRSLKSVYIVLVASRFLSFIFGIKNWLMGYCLLYFFVSIFVGWIIIDKHFPLKQQNKKEQSQRKLINALKTPQFALFALTVQIIVMILVQAYALSDDDPTLVYNNVNIPVWQWGILAVIGAWVIITYILSVRVLMRHRYKIFTLTQYYFGISKITQYHIYLATSYLLLIALGLYGDIYLKQKLILICCIFLPLIYLCLLGFFMSWANNQYMLLADIQQYNKISQKKYETKLKRAQLLAINEKHKDKKKQYLISTFKAKQTGQNFFSDFKHFAGSIGLVPDAQQEKEGSMNQEQISGSDIKPSHIGEQTKTMIKFNETEIQGFVPLRDWRNPTQNVALSEMFSCLTPNDKKIIAYTVVFVLISIGYCLASMLWGKNKFGISLIVCIISYLTLLPYIKFYKTKGEMLVGEILGNWAGFALGIIYWSVFNKEVVGPIAFSIAYMIISLFLLINCYLTELNVKVLISPALQILLCITFIQITLALHTNVILSVVFGLIFFIIIILQIPLYFQLAHQHIPKTIIAICAALIGSAVIALSVVGYAIHVLSSFAIFSIIMVLIFSAFFVTSIILYINKKVNEDDNPNIYSAYGEPHYRFDSAKEVIKPNNIHLVIFSFSMTTIVIFSAIVSVFFNEKQWAVFGLSFFWLIQSFISLQVAISSYIFIGTSKKDKLLNKEIILQSFKKLRDHYMVQQVAGEDSDWYEVKLKEAKQRVAQTNDAEDWKLVVTNHDLWTKNKKEEQLFLFFWIGLIMFHITTKKREIISQTLAEMKEIEEQLIANGIILQSLDLNLKPREKYEKAMREIQSLQPVDSIIYQQILEKHRAQTRQKKKQIEAMHQKQKKEIEKRNQQLYNEMKKHQTVDAKDQILQFQQMIKNLGKKNLYFDQEFPANQKILGQDLKSVVASWRRPNVGQMLTKSQKIASDEVIQGRIGDCYLISSFGVLGQKRIKQALGFDGQGKQKWSNTRGAFMVRFFKFGKEIYTIIDDLLPVNEQDQWIFAKSQDPTQYWPCILEKAYAKLYGGYNKIVEGKCHQVMAQFTGGFPFEIVLDEYKSNPNGLWNRIITSKKNGYLLASGSPPNPRGDSVASKRGIVQGHAYSVLDAKQIDEYKLIKLKNPHGSAGKQWNGDFSDKSDLMTKRMMGLLQHSRSNDGIFWMPIEDFLIQFKSLYICAVFDDRWKKLGPIQGQWTDANSFGTPNNPGAENNPHYGLQVTKKCTMFINLTQEAISSLKGKNAIFMKALKNNEKRITPDSITPENAVGRPKRPTDAVTISLQLQLEAQSYPSVFSLMVSCDQPGKTGKYTLQAYCDDKDAKIIDDLVFDRKN